MRTTVVFLLPLSLFASSTLAWNDLNYFPVPVDIATISKSLSRDDAASDSHRFKALHFKGMSIDRKLSRRYKRAAMDEQEFINRVLNDIDTRLRSSMSVRGEKMYDKLMDVSLAAWNGYSFFQNGKKLSFPLVKSRRAHAKISFDRNTEGAFVYTYTLSPKSNGRLMFKARRLEDDDGVFLTYSTKLD